MFGRYPIGAPTFGRSRIPDALVAVARKFLLLLGIGR